MDRLLSLAKEGNLKSIYLLNSPEGNFFAQDSIKELSDLERAGVELYWRNCNMDNKWMIYHSGFWIKPEKLRMFETYYKSGKFVVVYGSSINISEEDKRLVDGFMSS